MMSAFLAWALGTPLGRVLSGAVLCVLIFIGARWWLAMHDASTRREALVGYVLQSKADAAEAKLAEVQRQVAAGQIVIASYQEILKNARAKDAEDDAKFAKERKDFEALLVAAGRSCNLDAGDLQWLQH
ncbi:MULTISPECIES: hypothetical protein [unclassified Mesorhizobium]|uniref:hypothetical protein n=1 Tax=unclassified Mesorhizobium TaxID=325217 RepID=UPI000FDAB950|nr:MULTISPECIES: hypothetical protein [unclassified Mesorhizobium]TGT76699.1 hypothetical protein EN809_003590 [Mesorhizobium sp. M2E.F.Ca.ET.166.01.1.1]TGW02811.1 hypothetical protein EN797_003590 [Mesorhizobium sp. M2E.F.Ca.ET.154.01.1.1]